MDSEAAAARGALTGGAEEFSGFAVSGSCCCCCCCAIDDDEADAERNEAGTISSGMLCFTSFGNKLFGKEGGGSQGGESERRNANDSGAAEMDSCEAYLWLCVKSIGIIIFCNKKGAVVNSSEIAL